MSGSDLESLVRTLKSGAYPSNETLESFFKNENTQGFQHDTELLLDAATNFEQRAAIVRIGFTSSRVSEEERVNILLSQSSKPLFGELLEHGISGMQAWEARKSFQYTTQTKQQMTRNEPTKVDQQRALTNIAMAFSKKFPPEHVGNKADQRDEFGAFFDKQRTALHIAALQYCSDVIECLLEVISTRYPQDPERRREIVCQKDKTGMTALTHAIIAGDRLSVSKLISFEPKLLEERYSVTGEYPLHTAIDNYLDSQPTWPSRETRLAVVHAIAEFDSNSLSRQSYDFKSPIALVESMMESPSMGPDIPELANALRKWLYNLCFEKLDSVRDLEKALYGPRGKHLELVLSDFDYRDKASQISGFDKFVKTFKPLDNSNQIFFEKTLLRVRLPDMSHVLHCQAQKHVKALFLILAKKFGVEKIKRLEAYDNVAFPMNDQDISKIVEDFKVEDLRWYKYDFDIDLLPRHTHLKTISLYSAGNWGSLFYWTSTAGLVSFPNLKEARIEIVDEKGNLESRRRCESLKARADSRFKYSSEVIKTNAAKREEDYKQKSAEGAIEILEAKENLEVKRMDEGLRLQIVADVQPHRAPVQIIFGQKTVNERFFNVFQHVDRCLTSGRQQRGIYRDPTKQTRIKIAVIDNGFDYWQSTISENVVQGMSFDIEADGQRKPWFTATHAHGTQMASLIQQINPRCDLYLYRIHSGSVGIRTENAIQPFEAIEAAVEARVDIINLSWSFKTWSKELDEAVYQAAVMKEIPIFSSASDDPDPSEKAWPADSPYSIGVMAADHAGRKLTSAEREADILLLGDRVSAWGLSWFADKLEDVTGSSAATALASGIASVLLTYAMCASKNKSDWVKYKRRDRMLKLLYQMSTKQPVKEGDKNVHLDPYVLFKNCEDEGFNAGING